MTLLIVLGSFGAALFIFELLEALANSGNAYTRLQGIGFSDGEPGSQSNDFLNSQMMSNKSSWASFLTILLPGYFRQGATSTGGDVVDLLRRAGYPYKTTGVFYAAAIRTFTLFLVIGGLAAGLMVAAKVGVLLAVGTASIFVVLGLRRPYTKLRTLARKRATALRSNMLTGLAILNALLSAGVGVQESLRRSAGIGGPFCNLLGLMVAQMEVAPFMKAIEVVEAHVPDPTDVEVGLFLRAVREFYNQNRPLLPAVNGLQNAVQRDVLEETEARAALVRQRSGLFGVFAVLGLVISIIAPFLGVFS